MKTLPIVNHASQDSIKAMKVVILQFKALSPKMNLTEIKDQDICDPTHKAEFVLARQLLMNFLKFYTLASLDWIGLQAGGKDHATVIHSAKVINNYYEVDKHFKREYDRINLLVVEILKFQKLKEELPAKQISLQEHINILWDSWGWLKIA